jgi:hypothetical protein
VVSVFDEWGRRFGDRGQGLLMALGILSVEGTGDGAWRVGVLAQEEGERAAGGGASGARGAESAVRKRAGGNGECSRQGKHETRAWGPCQGYVALAKRSPQL